MDKYPNPHRSYYLKGIKFRDFAIFSLKGETFQVYNREIKYPRNLISGGFYYQQNRDTMTKSRNLNPANYRRKKIVKLSTRKI